MIPRSNIIQPCAQQFQPRTLGSGTITSLKLIGPELYVGFNDLAQNQFASIHAIDTRTGSEDWSASVKWNVGTLAIA